MRLWTEHCQLYAQCLQPDVLRKGCLIRCCDKQILDFPFVVSTYISFHLDYNRFLVIIPFDDDDTLMILETRPYSWNWGSRLHLNSVTVQSVLSVAWNQKTGQAMLFQMCCNGSSLSWSHPSWVQGEWKLIGDDWGEEWYLTWPRPPQAQNLMEALPYRLARMAKHEHNWIRPLKNPDLLLEQWTDVARALQESNQAFIMEHIALHHLWWNDEKLFIVMEPSPHSMPSGIEYITRTIKGLPLDNP
jgi:hypothetical protein